MSKKFRAYLLDHLFPKKRSNFHRPEKFHGLDPKLPGSTDEIASRYPIDTIIREVRMVEEKSLLTLMLNHERINAKVSPEAKRYVPLLRCDLYPKTKTTNTWQQERTTPTRFEVGEVWVSC